MQNEFSLTKENYILLAIGLVIIIVGFLLMAGGNAPIENPNAFYPNGDPTQTPELFSTRRITVAPIVVLIGFAFEFFAIMANPKVLCRKKITPDEKSLEINISLNSKA